jgi:hypothetical protein
MIYAVRTQNMKVARPHNFMPRTSGAQQAFGHFGVAQAMQEINASNILCSCLMLDSICWKLNIEKGPLQALRILRRLGEAVSVRGTTCDVA